MTFRVPKIKSCCCFSLETGTKIIACVDLFLGMVVLVFFMWYSFSRGMVFYFVQKGIQQTMFCQWFVMDIIMAYAAFTRNHVLLFPWILYQTTILILFLFSLFGSIVYLGLMDTRTKNMTVEFIGAFISLWPALVVYNFYRNLKEEDRRPLERI